MAQDHANLPGFGDGYEGLAWHEAGTAVAAFKPGAIFDRRHLFAAALRASQVHLPLLLGSPAVRGGGEEDEVGSMKSRPPVGKLADLGGGDRASLVAIGEGELALGENAVMAVALAEQAGGVGATQPVVDGARRDNGGRHPEACIAEPSSSGADQARLAAEQVETLE